MTEERKVIFRAEHLSKRFLIHSKKLAERAQVLHALSDVSFDVYEGETLGIIGESGCGKSTLGRCMVRLHQPSDGSVYYDDKDISKLKGRDLKEMRRHIQMVFQDPYSSLNPRKTAQSIIEEPMVIHGFGGSAREREERALSLMREVGLDRQHMQRFPHEFSGGQRQRINIARVLSLGPKVIVCDEPVSALDVSIQAQVLNLLSSLQEQHNLTYLFISHDLSVIKYVSDRIAIMYLGRIVELCKSEEIYKNPLHPYTRALLSAIPPNSPFEKKTQLRLKGEIPSPIGTQVGCPMAKRCPDCMERCKAETPALKTMDGNHQVACFLYQ